jgi:hypothetical protein
MDLRIDERRIRARRVHLGCRLLTHLSPHISRRILHEAAGSSISGTA